MKLDCTMSVCRTVRADMDNGQSANDKVLYKKKFEKSNAEVGLASLVAPRKSEQSTSYRSITSSTKPANPPTMRLVALSDSPP